MNNVEDPKKQVDYLMTCLSSDKRPIGLFLGAGCPMAIKQEDEKKTPLIPDIKGITKIVREKLPNCEECGPLLKKVEEHFQRDDRKDTTIEDMLSHIRALLAVAGKDKVRDLSADELDKMDRNICQIINDIVDKPLPDNKTPYHHIASWVEAVRREDPVEIFTTNYDLLMEQAFEDCRVPYFDGFAGGRKPFFDLRAMEEDILPARWARLWKLHGSINWYQVAEKGVFRATTIEGSDLKRVIHPSHLKYEESRRMPYLAMIDQLRSFLKRPTATLVICGYSFHDAHINEVIVQGLQSTLGAMAFALLFDKIAEYSQGVKLSFKCSNLSILARDGAVISCQESNWMEKDAEALSSDNSTWVRWMPVDSAKNNNKKTAEFTLGDFATFGKFVKELVGNTRHTPEIRNAQ